MTDDLIERLWREAPEEPTMSQAQLVDLLQPRVERSSRTLSTYVWAYVLLQLATLLLVGANIAGYRANPAMLGAEVSIALTALACAIHGVRLYGEVRRLDQLDVSLAAVLQRRISFYSSKATAWMWLAALSLVGFTFALNSLVDNVEGRYPIHHPFVFVGVQVAMVLTLVASFRLAFEPRLRELRAVLGDLEAQVLDRTAALDEELVRWKRWRMALIALLSMLLALGAWMALRA